MRILIVTGIFPPDIGGPATYVAHIAQALARRGHRVTVFTLSARREGAAHPAGAARDFEVVLMRRALLRPLRQLLTVVRLLIVGRSADILYVNGLFLETMSANFVLRKPSVHKVVGDMAWERAMVRGWVNADFEEFQGRTFGWNVELMKALQRLWTRRADYVIVPSQYLARWVVGWGVPKEKVVTIPNAPAHLDNVVPADVPIDTSMRVITVGRLVPWKRVDRIIDALSELDGIGLVVVGDGPERARLEDLIQRRGLCSRVFLAGEKSHAETLAFIRSCDILVLNSTYEGLPHVILEAMTMGVPVVATPAGGTAEIVEHGVNGWLIDFSIDSLQAALRRLMQDEPLRRRLAIGARLTVARSHSFDLMVEGTEEVLQHAQHRR